MSNKNHPKPEDSTKKKWIDGRRRCIEVILVGCFERHGSFSKYVWKTKPARGSR